MAYATSADLTTYFSAAEVLIAADRDGSGVADTGVIDAALQAATEEIDSYLVIKYNLPLTSSPGILLNVCLDIAMYRMSIHSTSMTEEKRNRYKDAVSWLTKVAKGIVALGPEETEETSNDVVTLADTNETRIFTRTKMAGLL